MISFNCPYCAHAFNVEDVLAGKEINCPGCEGKVPVPGPTPVGNTPAPQPATIDPAKVAEQMQTSKANTQSTIALVLGAISLVCGCITMPFSIVFGIMAMTKTGVDPTQTGTIRIKSIAGIGMSLIFTLIWTSIAFLGAHQTEKKRLLQDSELIVAQKAYEENEFEKAIHIYEMYAEEGYDKNIKALCNLKLGQIAFARKNESKAKNFFRKAVNLKNSIELESENPEEKELFRKARVHALTTQGQIYFPKPEVKGTLSEKVRFTSWRIVGKRIKCNVRFPGNWSEMQISWAVYGENNELIGDYNFDSAPSDDDDNIGYLYLDWKADWDLIRKIIVHVNRKE